MRLARNIIEDVNEMMREWNKHAMNYVLTNRVKAPSYEREENGKEGWDTPEFYGGRRG